MPVSAKKLIPLTLFILFFTTLSAVEININRTFTTQEEPEFTIYGNPGASVFIRIYQIENPAEFLSGQKDAHTTTLPVKRLSPGGAAMWKSFAENMKWSLYAGARRYMRTDKREELRKALNLKTYAYPFQDRFPDRNLFSPLKYKLIKETSEKPKREYGWFNRTIKPGKLNPGFYLVEASQGRSIAFSPLLVSDLVLLTKEGLNTRLAWGINITDGSLAAGARLTVFNPSDSGIKATSEHKLSDGIWFDDAARKKNETHQTVYMLNKGEHYALSDIYFYRNHNNQYRTAIYTERPVYRAGHEVFFKGIIMKSDKGRLSPVQGEYHVTVTDTAKKKLFSKKILFSKFGTFNSSLVLPDNAQPGAYTIETSVDGKALYGTFYVEQYKKPVFKVEISSDKKIVLRGEPNVVSLQANYYSGEAIQNAKAQYDIQRKRVSFPWWYGYDYAWYYADSSDYGYWENVSSAETTTDKNGNAKIQFIAPAYDEKDPSDYTYRITASVTSKTRDEISASAEFKVVRSEFSMRLTQDKWYYSKKDRAEVKAELKTWAGNQPAVGLQVDAEVFLTTYDYKTQLNKREKVTNVSGKSDQSGIATLVLPEFKSGGTYEVIVTARDGKGRKVTEIQDFWVSSEGGDSYAQTEEKITITPEKTRYSPGETALLNVTSSFKKGKVLITYENSDVIFHEVKEAEQLKEGLKLLVKPEYMPNVKITVNAFEYKNKVISHQGMYELILPPVQNFLNVELLTDRESFRPGEKGKFLVKISDHKGVPVQGEYSLAVVDESIFTIRSESVPDLTRALYPKTIHSVVTSDSLSFRFYGNSKEAELYTKLISDRDRILAKFKNEKTQIKIRKNFKDTAFWLAQGKTDSRGIAHISFDFPDNLTSWRLTTHAIGESGLTGTGKKNIKVSKDFALRLASPRFLREKDKISLGLVISNQLKEKVKADISIKTKDLSLKNDYAKTVTLDAGSEKRIDFTAMADMYPVSGNAIITATANVPGIDSDGIEIPLPVLPYGVEQIISGSVVLENKETSGKIKLNLPKEARDVADRLTVSYINGVLPSVYETLPYLVNYPYGCVEQTLSSFVPAMWAKQMSTKWKIPLPVKPEQLSEIASSGLDKLYLYQHADGGWGWWSDDATHPYMTAYVLDGLKQAADTGIKIKTDVVKKGLESLKKQIVSPETDTYFRESEDFIKAYQYYVLSLYEKIPDDFLKSAETLTGKNSENAYVQALLALAAQNWKQKKLANSLLDKTLTLAVEKDNGTSFTKGKKSSWYWYNDDEETTAFVIEAALKINRKKTKKILPDAVKYLILKKQDRKWRSTKTSAMVTKAFSAFALATGEKPVKTNVKIAVNNDEKSFKFNPADYKLSDTNADFKMNTKTAEINISREGKGFFMTKADWKYYKGGQIIAPFNTDFKVTRRYFRLNKSGNELKKENHDTVKFKAGDYVISETTVNLPEKSEYILTEDFLPSGFEVVEGEALNTLGQIHDWDSYYSAKTRLDDRVGVSRTWSHNNTWRTQVVLRAAFPGEYQVMPAQSGLMYYPETTAHSSSNVLTITE